MSDDLEETAADDAAADKDDDAGTEDPTAVESPLAEDETSPEGIPTDAETTGVEQVDPYGGEGDDPFDNVDARGLRRGDAKDNGPESNAGDAEPEVEPQARLFHKPPRSLPWRIARLAAAPLLAGAAFGVHMWLNVPDEPVVSQSRDQGAKKKKKPRNNRRQKMPERSAEQMDAAWDRWGGMPFEEEPLRGRWPRDMQTMVNKAVVVARKAAFEGSVEDPQVIVTGTQCRTIRCRFVLRSPYEHEVNLLAKALTTVTYDDEPMWRDVQTEAIDPPTPQSPKDDHYLRVVVGLAADGYESAAIEVPEQD